MKRLELLTKLIIKGERLKAEALLDSIYEESQCHIYSVALEKILLIEIAKALNDSVKGFYLDCEKLKEALFSDNPPTRKTVFDSMRDILAESSEENERIAYEKARDYIKRNLLSNQLSVGKTSEYAGVSERTLIRLFKENEGKTAGEYISFLRVEESIAHLLENKSVALAAEKSGFSSVEAYIRAFKKVKSTTPAVWKRNKLFL